MFQVYKVSNELKNYVSVWEDIVKGGHGHKQWSRSAINNFDIGMNKIWCDKWQQSEYKFKIQIFNRTKDLLLSLQFIRIWYIVVGGQVWFKYFVVLRPFRYINTCRLSVLLENKPCQTQIYFSRCVEIETRCLGPIAKNHEIQLCSTSWFVS